MEKSGFVVEVLGIPEGFPDKMIFYKLHDYFLRFGGGSDLKVLYPCYRPDRAIIVFPDKEAGVRVLRSHSHELELDRRQYRLRVKEADRPAGDLPAEATLHLNSFRDEAEVRKIVGSHGFVIRDLDRDQVRIKGSFSQLRELKSHLERLQNSQNQTRAAPHPSSPGVHHQAVSSGAIPKRPTRERSVSNGSRTANFASSQPERSSLKASGSRRRRATSLYLHSPPGRHSFAVDGVVLQYAQRFRKKELDVILVSHHATFEVHEDDPDISSVTLCGKEADQAAEKLKQLLNHLNTSLRTQEIPLKDLDPDSRAALFKRIQREKDTPALIVQLQDEVRVVGTSAESYEVKQRLLGSGATKPIERRRSFLLKGLFRGSKRVNAKVSPAGAPDSSASKPQDDQRAEPKRGAAARLREAFRRRSSSAPGGKAQPKKGDDVKQETENKSPSQLKKGLVPLFGKFKLKK